VTIQFTANQDKEARAMPQKHPTWATSTAAILVLAAGVGSIDSQAAETEETVAVTDRRIVFDSGDSLLRPSVLPTAEGYRMWYTAVERPPKDDPLFQKYPWMADGTHIWEIRYATSTDGTNWATKGTVLRPGLYGGRRTIQVLMPEVIVDGDILRMYLTVREDTTANYWLMQCQSEDGITWTDPVMAIDTGEKGRPDDGHTSGCSVLKENGVYRMWYGAYCLEDRKFRTMYAESTDGTTWERGDVARLGTGSFGILWACEIGDGLSLAQIGDGLFWDFLGLKSSSPPDRVPL
jgi:hypothetical protein